MSKKNSIFSHYVNHVRRSSKHIQQIHALLFAGGITVLLAFFILYFDYGFWRERYNSNEVIIKEKIEDRSKSPTEMFSQFISEVGSKIDTAKSGGNALLEGRDSYSKREEFLFGTTTGESQ